jgi:mono/diheme cytochrome c family protein
MTGRMKQALSVASIPFILWSALALAQNPPAAPPPKPAPPANAAEALQKRGERAFTANCSRCHMPPMTIPPRITGTVLMHMRVRARLSREDQQAILKFMTP